MEPIANDSTSGSGAYQSYLENSAAPLTGFIFVLPLFLAYHIGLWLLSSFSDLKWANAVDITIADTLGRLGIVGPGLSFFLAVLVFLALNALSGKTWHVPPAYTWLAMLFESLVMALPVFMLSRIVLKLMDSLSLSILAGEDGSLSWQANLVLSCGAGVYEEFFFRVLIMGLMIVILDRVFGVKSSWKFGIAAILQALLFSATHHLPGGPEAIATFADARAYLPVFCFRTVAGIYFAYLYIERGFGIAAGAHAGYDLLVVLLDMFMPLE